MAPLCRPARQPGPNPRGLGSWARAEANPDRWPTGIARAVSNHWAQARPPTRWQTPAWGTASMGASQRVQRWRPAPTNVTEAIQAASAQANTVDAKPVHRLRPNAAAVCGSARSAAQPWGCQVAASAAHRLQPRGNSKASASAITPSCRTTCANCRQLGYCDGSTAWAGAALEGVLRQLALERLSLRWPVRCRRSCWHAVERPCACAGVPFNPGGAACG